MDPYVDKLINSEHNLIQISASFSNTCLISNNSSHELICNGSNIFDQLKIPQMFLSNTKQVSVG